jgi:hypothetical protein
MGVVLTLVVALNGRTDDRGGPASRAQWPDEYTLTLSERPRSVKAIPWEQDILSRFRKVMKRGPPTGAPFSGKKRPALWHCFSGHQ